MDEEFRDYSVDLISVEYTCVIKVTFESSPKKRHGDVKDADPNIQEPFLNSRTSTHLLFRKCACVCVGVHELVYQGVSL